MAIITDGVAVFDTDAPRPPGQVIVFNDLHLADRPPQARADDYTTEGLNMLSEVVGLARERNAEAIISTGDLFHAKAPSKNSHALVYQVIEILREAPCPVIVVPGNHDMTERGYDSIPQQPLGVLEAALVVTIPSMATTPHFAIFSRPYSERWDVDPTYYRPDPQDLPQARGKVVVVAAHGSLVPVGEERPYPVLTIDQLDWSYIDFLVSGHIHEDLGIHHLNGNVFANVGALGRVSKTLANMARTVKVVSIHSDKSIEEIPLKSALPALEIFRPDDPETKQDEDAIQQFVTNLTRSLGADSIDLLDLVHQGDVPENIRAHLLHYLQEAGA